MVIGFILTLSHLVIKMLIVSPFSFFLPSLLIWIQA